MHFTKRMLSKTCMGFKVAGHPLCMTVVYSSVNIILTKLGKQPKQTQQLNVTIIWAKQPTLFKHAHNRPLKHNIHTRSYNTTTKFKQRRQQKMCMTLDSVWRSINKRTSIRLKMSSEKMSSKELRLCSIN